MRRLNRSLAFTFGVLMLASACAEAPMDSNGETHGEDSEGDGDGDGDDELPLANGVSIRRVEANQGVQVDVGVGNEYVGQRDVSLIRGRGMLVRALIDVDDDWEPRELMARLTLSRDGEVETRDVTAMVLGSSAENGRDFAWVLPAEEVLPGLEYQVAFYETDPELPAADGPGPVTPSSGPEPLGVEDVEAEMKILLVPIHDTSCGKTAVIDEEVIESFRAKFFGINPVQDVHVDVRPDPFQVEVPDTCSPSQFLELIALRQQDGAAPNEFYVGVAPVCGDQTCYCHTVGNNDADSKYSARTMVVTPNQGDEPMPEFCFGQLQGRRPVPGCGTAGVDPDYPHEDGTIGTWGYSVEQDILTPPTHFSFMNFCGPEWVSDWGWRQQHENIQLLTGWGE